MKTCRNKNISNITIQGDVNSRAGHAKTLPRQRDHVFFKPPKMVTMALFRCGFSLKKPRP